VVVIVDVVRMHSPLRSARNPVRRLEGSGLEGGVPAVGVIPSWKPGKSQWAEGSAAFEACVGAACGAGFRASRTVVSIRASGSLRTS
jgi:hypothetical protein